MLAMTCAEVGSATWLMIATGLGMPVSTTQTIVGALIGVGFASQSQIKWGWTKGSVSQVAASWGIAPFIAGAFSALVFATIKYSVLERTSSLGGPMNTAGQLIIVHRHGQLQMGHATYPHLLRFHRRRARPFHHGGDSGL